MTLWRRHGTLGIRGERREEPYGSVKIEMIIRMEKLTELKVALGKHGVEGMRSFRFLAAGFRRERRSMRWTRTL